MYLLSVNQADVLFNHKGGHLSFWLMDSLVVKEGQGESERQWGQKRGGGGGGGRER